MFKAKNTKKHIVLLGVCVWFVCGSILQSTLVVAAPSPDLWARWQTNSPGNSQIIDHSKWTVLLKKYLVINHPTGINRFRYKDITPKDRQTLDEYLIQLQSVQISSLNPKVQKAYWVNLYNALTIQVILNHYPVKSIMDIDISPGFFSSGPWGAKLVTLEKEAISLNDIEHRILRPIFNDNRLHYALNCASIGCPNRQPTAFTVSNTEKLLESAAGEYINSPRGVMFSKGTFRVSNIYKWFQVDFGNSEKGVIRHLGKYFQGEGAEQLKTYEKGLSYDYNWQLNEP